MSSFNVKTILRDAIPRSLRRRQGAVTAGAVSSSSSVLPSSQADNEIFKHLRLVSIGTENPIMALVTDLHFYSEKGLAVGGVSPSEDQSSAGALWSLLDVAADSEEQAVRRLDDSEYEFAQDGDVLFYYDGCWYAKPENAGGGTAVSWGTAGADNVQLTVAGDTKTLLTNHQSLSGYQTKIDSQNKLSASLVSGLPSTLPCPKSLSFGNKTYDGSTARTITASDLGAITSVTLAMLEGAIGSADGSYLKIGNIKLVYDSANNAIRFVNATSGQIANVFASGGLTAGSTS